VEPLEDRLALAGGVSSQVGGEVVGRVFGDLNNNGVRDAGEPGLAQRVVYADANGDGRLDPGEASASTDATGAYELALPPGRYTIRLDSGSAETTTTPADGSYEVSATWGFAVVGRDFGVLDVNPATPLPRATAPLLPLMTPNEAYVQGLYLDVLGRVASPTELASLTSLLPPKANPASAASRAARAVVARRVWNSPEHRALEIQSYYQSLLQRQASPAETAAGVRAFRAGAGELGVVRRILASPMYARLYPSDSAFVTALYNDILGRDPSAGDLDARVGALHRGVGRHVVVDGLLSSNESLTRMVDSFVAAYLNLTPHEAPQKRLLAGLKAKAVSPAAVGQAILASNPNYFAGLTPSPGVEATPTEDLPLMPGPTVDCASDVLWYDQSAQLKTITLTNNSEQTVYPILQGANSRTTAADDAWYGTPVFDPHDNLNNEYRGYIGYSLDGNNYLGLPAHQSITINVPLVFWDGGRINVATDSTYLTPPGATTESDPVNPFHFYYNNPFETDLASTSVGSNVLTFTGQQGNPGVTPATLANGFVPNTILVTGPGVPDKTYIQSLGSGTLTLTQHIAPTTDPLTNVQFTFTWPLPKAGDQPAGPATDRFVVDAVSSSSGLDGKIMWYHALASQTPANDAPDQLLEMTFRDDYLSGLSTAQHGLIPESEQHALVNYDVSYVDSILQPVAMEATNVPIQNFPTDDPAFGWIGASQTVDQLQGKIAAFASNDPSVNGLGQYFGGNGYPSYYYPNTSASGVKLPSGQNLFGDSPYNDVRSSYDNNLYALTSGGATTIGQVVGGTPQNTSDADYLWLSTSPNDLPKLKALAAGLAGGSQYDVTSSGGDLLPGTKLTKVALDAQGQPTGQVFLSTTTTGTHAPYVYTFSRPAQDYAANRIINLWYSWANYYVQNAGVAPQSLLASTTKDSRLIKLSSAIAPGTLVPGMAVQGANIPAGATIMEVGSDGLSIYLSKVASATTTAPESYSFTPPQMSAILGSNDPAVGTLIKFTGLDPTTALAFAQNAYEVMTAMSTIAPDGSTHPLSVQLMFNVIGCNVGKLKNIQGTGEDKDAISNDIRDMTKSLLRGVTDFATDVESDGHWYPDPSVPTGGQDFNVYNLDPFVWFVHKRLGLSGYGFSVDDDVADVGADLATKLSVGIAGLGNPGDAFALPQQAEWTFGAPYGPLTSTATVGADLKSLSLSDSKVFWQLFPSDDSAGFVGALVNGPGVQPGTRLSSRTETGNVFGLNCALDKNAVQAGSSYTFSFYGPVSGFGQIASGNPSLITGFDPEVVAQLAVIGPGVQVAGLGIAKGTKLLKVDSTNNTVELTQAASPTSDPVRFTFS
jgi:hypothetical protein